MPPYPQPLLELESLGERGPPAIERGDGGVDGGDQPLVTTGPHGSRSEHDAVVADADVGNVQRAVLARELAGEAELLLVSNPVFGLDFAAVAEIHGRLLAARDRGAAVLLVSEDLDELLALADRIVVMSEGRIVHDVPAAEADRASLGAFMGGRDHGHGAAHDAGQVAA